MNTRYLVVAALAFAASTSTHAADPADHNGIHNDQLGTSVSVKAARVVKIAAATRYINAEHFEVVTIQNDQGQSFTWQFDTLIAATGFPLRRIAPPGFDSGNAWVYISRPRHHIVSD